MGGWLSGWVGWGCLSGRMGACVRGGCTSERVCMHPEGQQLELHALEKQSSLPACINLAAEPGNWHPAPPTLWLKKTTSLAPRRLIGKSRNGKSV